jgi:prepilin-type N-terminal cleavage/methylation domain-containing protein
MKNSKIINNMRSSPLSKGDYRGFFSKYIIRNVSAFTLIEVLVSITIFSIMMISILSIYIISSDITLKSDINRIMQENLKNVSSRIAEDIRKE